jgi:hypothetical protein
MGSIPITVSDVVRETTLNFTVDILSFGFSCVVFKILDKSKKEGRVMEKILSKIVILIVWVVFSTSATACIQGGIPT